MNSTRFALLRTVISLGFYVAWGYWFGGWAVPFALTFAVWVYWSDHKGAELKQLSRRWD